MLISFKLNILIKFDADVCSQTNNSAFSASCSKRFSKPASQIVRFSGFHPEFHPHSVSWKSWKCSNHIGTQTHRFWIEIRRSGPPPRAYFDRLDEVEVYGQYEYGPKWQTLKITLCFSKKFISQNKYKESRTIRIRRNMCAVSTLRNRNRYMRKTRNTAKLLKEN